MRRSGLHSDIPVQFGRMYPDLIGEITARAKNFRVAEPGHGIEDEIDLPLLYLKRRAVGPDRVRSICGGSAAETDQNFHTDSPAVGRGLVPGAKHPLRSGSDG